MLDITAIHSLGDLSHSLAHINLFSASMALDWSSFDISNHLDFGQSSWQIHWQQGLHHTSELIAQATKEGQFQGDVLGDMGKGWRKFVESGQIWAMIIGAIAGYLFRSVTSM